MSRPVAIGIVDYGMGNRRSVEKAFQHVGADTRLTADTERLGSGDGLVVPGVGAFPQGMRNLRELELAGLIGDWARAGRPLLGICLGMQLLFDRSDELGGSDGLGLIPGEVSRLLSAGRRVPHIGWNDVRFQRPCPLTTGLADEGCPFYHVHSYAAHPSDQEDVVGTTDYGERFATIVARGSVFGVQFHPEKSSTDGLRLLRNFVEMCRASAPAPAGSVPLRA